MRKMARPERFELPTSWFVARRSIQLSYGRGGAANSTTSTQEYGITLGRSTCLTLAEREGFEPSMGF